MPGQKIAVVGATGRVGRYVMRELEQLGFDTVPIARSVGVDVITGTGLAEALDRVDAVVDAATGPSPDQEEATAFFTTAARNLHRVGETARVSRIVSVSIIGVDRFTAGYGRAKQRHEEAVLSGPIPAQVLRASQFHEFVPLLISWGRQGDVSHLQEARIQPIAARSVAHGLIEAVIGDWTSTSGPIVEIAGPREESLVALAGLWAARYGDPVVIEGTSNAADPDHELHETGALLPSPDARLAGPAFEEWLDSEDARAASSA